MSDEHKTPRVLMPEFIQAYNEAMIEGLKKTVDKATFDRVVARAGGPRAANELTKEYMNKFVESIDAENFDEETLRSIFNGCGHCCADNFMTHHLGPNYGPFANTDEVAAGWDKHARQSIRMPGGCQKYEGSNTYILHHETGGNCPCPFGHIRTYFGAEPYYEKATRARCIGCGESATALCYRKYTDDPVTCKTLECAAMGHKHCLFGITVHPKEA